MKWLYKLYLGPPTARALIFGDIRWDKTFRVAFRVRSKILENVKVYHYLLTLYIFYIILKYIIKRHL